MAAEKKSNTLTGVPPVKGGGKGHVADEGAGVLSPRLLELDGAAVGDLAQHALNRELLPGAVGADEGHDLAAVEVEVDVPEDVRSTHVTPRCSTRRQQAPAQPAPWISCFGFLIHRPSRIVLTFCSSPAR